MSVHAVDTSTFSFDDSLNLLEILSDYFCKQSVRSFEKAFYEENRTGIYDTPRIKRSIANDLYDKLLMLPRRTVSDSFVNESIETEAINIYRYIKHNYGHDVDIHQGIKDRFYDFYLKNFMPKVDRQVSYAMRVKPRLGRGGKILF